MKTLLALSAALAAFCFSSNSAAASTLTVCNSSDTTTSGFFLDPIPAGYHGDHAKRLAPGQCLPLPGIPDGQYKVDFYYGNDCFQPIAIYGDSTYTFDQAAKDACDREEMESLQ
jgi:hypothetical protein